MHVLFIIYYFFYKDKSTTSKCVLPRWRSFRLLWESPSPLFLSWLQSLSPKSSPEEKKQNKTPSFLNQKDLYNLNDAQLGNFCSGMMTQMTGQREERWQREDGWLQESVATGGQHIPLLAEGSWGTGHDAACARVCVCVCVTLSVAINTHLYVQDKHWESA